MGRNFYINGESTYSYSRHNSVLVDKLFSYRKKHWTSYSLEDIYTKQDLIEMINEIKDEFESEYVTSVSESINEKAQQISDSILLDDEPRLPNYDEKYDSETNDCIFEYKRDDFDNYIFDDDESTNEIITNKIIISCVDALDIINYSKNSDICEIIMKLIEKYCFNDHKEAIRAIANAIPELYEITSDSCCGYFFKDCIIDGFDDRWILDSTDLSKDYNKQIADKYSSTHRMHNYYQERGKDYFTEILDKQKKYKNAYEELKSYCLNKTIVDISYV